MTGKRIYHQKGKVQVILSNESKRFIFAVF